jgi:hypothetical protein
MDQPEHISGDTVFKGGYLSFALDLEAARGYLLRVFVTCGRQSPIPSLVFPRVRNINITNNMRLQFPIPARAFHVPTADLHVEMLASSL